MLIYFRIIVSRLNDVFVIIYFCHHLVFYFFLFCSLFRLGSRPITQIKAGAQLLFFRPNLAPKSGLNGSFIFDFSLNPIQGNFGAQTELQHGPRSRARSSKPARGLCMGFFSHERAHLHVHLCMMYATSPHLQLHPPASCVSHVSPRIPILSADQRCIHLPKSRVHPLAPVPSSNGRIPHPSHLLSAGLSLSLPTSHVKAASAFSSHCTLRWLHPTASQPRLLASFFLHLEPSPPA